jgi:hypothetical protein
LPVQISLKIDMIFTYMVKVQPQLGLNFLLNPRIIFVKQRLPFDVLFIYAPLSLRIGINVLGNSLVYEILGDELVEVQEYVFLVIL